jgi:hypothetical protein
MDEWLPPAVGFGLVAALIATVLLFPDSWLGLELRRAYQVQTSGVLGRFVARDFVRTAVMSFTIAVLLTVSSYVAMTVSFRRPGTTGLLLEVYGFAFFLLAGVTFLATIQTLVRAFRVRRTERRVAELIAIQPDLFAALRDIVARYDPIGLAALNEPLEYDYQAGRILLALSRCGTYDEVFAMIRGHFSTWFPWADPHLPATVAALSQEVWNLINRPVA